MNLAITNHLADAALWIVLILFAVSVVGVVLFLKVEPPGVTMCPNCDNVMTNMPEGAICKAICQSCGFKERRWAAGGRRRNDKEKT